MDFTTTTVTLVGNMTTDLDQVIGGVALVIGAILAGLIGLGFAMRFIKKRVGSSAGDYSYRVTKRGSRFSYWTGWRN